MALQRIVVDLRSGETVLRVLYRSKGETNPGTKARTREVTGLARAGLRDALEALEGGDVTMCGTSGYSTREDLLVVETKDARIAREAS
jgi:hypothetical protein